MVACAADPLFVSDCRTIAGFFSPIKTAGCPNADLPRTYRCARKPVGIFVSAGPITAQTRTTFPETSSCSLPRMVPLYFSSAPVPAALKPQVIFCPTSLSGVTSVQVNTPTFVRACSAQAALAVTTSQITETLNNLPQCMDGLLSSAAANVGPSEKLPRPRAPIRSTEHGGSSCCHRHRPKSASQWRCQPARLELRMRCRRRAAANTTAKLTLATESAPITIASHAISRASSRTVFHIGVLPQYLGSQPRA